MPTQRLIVTGANASGGLLGRFIPFPNPRDSLYAGWLLGSALNADPMRDVSGARRDLVLSAGAFGTRSITCSTAKYLTAPFSGREVAKVTGGVTLVCVAKSPAYRNHYLIGDYENGARSAIVLLATSSASLNIFAVDGGQYTAQIGNEPDPERGMRYEFCAGAFTETSLLAYRGWGYLQASAAETAHVALQDHSFRRLSRLGSDSPIILGSGPGRPYSPASSPELVAAAVYSSALTVVELNAVREALWTDLAQKGLAL